MTTVAFCEIDPFCRKIISKHWPDVPIHEDVRKIDGALFNGSIDVVCGGFPCQPFSQAGEQRGQEDDRDLWPEMFRIIQESKPSWVIGENVDGFIRMELDRTLSDLESIGYECQSIVIPACAVGAPHRRSRVWIIAHAHSATDGEQHLPESKRSDCKGSLSNVAHAASKRLERWNRPEASRIHEVGSGSGGGTRINEWSSEPRICRVVNGLPNRVDRIRGLGNAVVPQIPEIIGRIILQSNGE